MAIGETITKNTTDGDGNPIVQTLEVTNEEVITNIARVKTIISETIKGRVDLGDNTVEDLSTLISNALNDSKLIA